MQAHANNIDSLHTVGANERCSSDSDAAGLDTLMETNAQGLCSVCVGCKILWPKGITHMHVSASIHNNARNFSVIPGLMVRTYTKVEFLWTTDLR